MTTMAAPLEAIDDAKARRNLRVLMAAQMILGSQMPVNFILGGLAGQVLSPDKCLSTLPITLMMLKPQKSVEGIPSRRLTYRASLRRDGFD